MMNYFFLGEAEASPLGKLNRRYATCWLLCDIGLESYPTLVGLASLRDLANLRGLPITLANVEL